MHGHAPSKQVGIPLTHASERLAAYAERIRRATAHGHRLNFTAEALLHAIQQTSRSCVDVLARIEPSDDPQNENLREVIAAQGRIDDAVQALKERMPFTPL